MKGFVIEKTIWRVINGKCVNIERYFELDERHVHTDVCKCDLAHYLSNLGFDIPSEISYCVASTDEYRLKYRVENCNTYVYITPNK